MHGPILPIVHTITSDRMREAEAARLAQSITQQSPEQSQRPRRFRALRLAFSR